MSNDAKREVEESEAKSLALRPLWLQSLNISLAFYCLCFLVLSLESIHKGATCLHDSMVEDRMTCTV